MKIKSAAEFELWVSQAMPGERCTYHVGENVKIGRLNDRVRMAYNAGEITLTRRRLSHGTGKDSYGSKWEFIAVRLKDQVVPNTRLPLDTLS